MRSLRILKVLFGASRGAMLLMAATGIVSGLCSIGIIALITRQLHAPDSSRWWLLGAFAALLAGKIGCGMASQLLLTRYSQETILDLSLELCRRILKAPLRTLEREGQGSLLTVLTDDVSTVTWAIQCIPSLATNAAVVLGCGMYLLWLSPTLFLAALLITTLGMLSFKAINDRAVRSISAARDARSTLLHMFGSLIAGLKELMLNGTRRREYISGSIAGAAGTYRDTNLRATTHHVLAEAWVQLLLYSLIACLLFVVPAWLPQSPETLTSYAFSVLYMMSPLWTIMGSVPAVLRGQVALDKIESLGIRLDEVGDDLPTTREPDTAREHSIRLEQVNFSYEARDNDVSRAFSIGPLDFTLDSGEVVFLIGGNGSGKTTFAKVLTGLYRPDGGRVILDGATVGVADQQRYRDNFAAVFADFHLFEELLGMPESAASEAASYLKMLRMEEKVRLENGKFSTTALSQGQRKRLALLVALLEDRPFYVFDEWAADQDPEYKAIFYGSLLPGLRKRGKGVLVITHDDRYFNSGDRVIRFDDGTIAPQQSA